jgi:hypothetical protein
MPAAGNHSRLPMIAVLAHRVVAEILVFADPGGAILPLMN